MDNTSPIAPDALIAEALNCPADDISQGIGLGLHPKWDSLAQVRVMMLLEQHYDVPIDDQTISMYQTFSAIEKRYTEISNA
jgi:acyl carrier protein